LEDNGSKFGTLALIQSPFQIDEDGGGNLF
jgi:hypothetical protein